MAGVSILNKGNQELWNDKELAERVRAREKLLTKF